MFFTFLSIFINLLTLMHCVGIVSLGIRAFPFYRPMQIVTLALLRCFVAVVSLAKGLKDVVQKGVLAYLFPWEHVIYVLCGLYAASRQAGLA